MNLKSTAIQRKRMKKCPYCFEVVEEPAARCVHCLQFFIDSLIDADYRSLDKKKCIFCGKKILSEAKICRFCRHWLDEVNRTADDIDKID